jgi:hypothetical protein
MRDKIQSLHLKRRAYVYVRQSTAMQVFANTESTARQYALVERARALGWPEEAIEVIDEDLGRSGARHSAGNCISVHLRVLSGETRVSRWTLTWRCSGLFV